jgi:methylmalonyl-CoA mutase, N-terminal domain
MGRGSILEGVLNGIDDGYFLGEIADAAAREQARFDELDLIRVGVNRYVEPMQNDIEMLQIPMATEDAKVASVRELHGRRDQVRVDAALMELERVATSEANVMPALLDCARAYCTEGEMVGALRAVFGTHPETIRI